jgi:hypothetical protein
MEDCDLVRIRNEYEALAAEARQQLKEMEVAPRPK